MGFRTMELSGERKASNVQGVVTSAAIITANPKAGKVRMPCVRNGLACRQKVRDGLPEMFLNLRRVDDKLI